MKAKVNSTGKTFKISYTRNEFGTTAYALEGNNGEPVWNGNTRMFSESQVTVIA